MEPVSPLSVTVSGLQLGSHSGIQKAVDHPDHANDWKGVWHDLLWMSHVSPVQSLPGGRLFRVIITGTGRRCLHTLKIQIHPGDNGEPCATIMLPEED
jgi:hypothetical protein